MSGTGSGTDVINLDGLQDSEFLASGLTAFEVLYAGFGGPLQPAGTSGTEQLFINGTGLTPLGPLSPPPAISSDSATFPIGATTNPLDFDGRLSASFGAGSAPGSFVIVSTVPISPLRFQNLRRLSFWGSPPPSRCWLRAGSGRDGRPRPKSNKAHPAPLVSPPGREPPCAKTA